MPPLCERRGPMFLLIAFVLGTIEIEGFGAPPKRTRIGASLRHRRSTYTASPASTMLAAAGLSRSSSSRPDPSTEGDYEDQGPNSRPPTPKKRQRALLSKTRMAAVVTFFGLYRLIPSTSAAARASLVALMSVLVLWRKRRQHRRCDDDSFSCAGGDDFRGGHFDGADESREKRDSAWVFQRLSDAERREEEEEALRQEELSRRKEQQMKQARRWATATLQNTQQLQEEARERKIREEEARRRTKMWVENAARGTGITLGAAAATAAADTRDAALESHRPAHDERDDQNYLERNDIQVDNGDDSRYTA